MGAPLVGLFVNDHDQMIHVGFAAADSPGVLVSLLGLLPETTRIRYLRGIVHDRVADLNLRLQLADTTMVEKTVADLRRWTPPPRGAWRIDNMADFTLRFPIGGAARGALLALGRVAAFHELRVHEEFAPGPDPRTPGRPEVVIAGTVEWPRATQEDVRTTFADFGIAHVSDDFPVEFSSRSS